MLTQARLKEVLEYDPETGVFRRKSDLKSIDTIAMKRYRVFYMDGKKYLLHRLAWLYVTGNFPEEEIDHINLNGLDNRFVNLRAATHAENVRNVKIRRHNTSGVKGVSWSKIAKKWWANIRFEGKTRHLGFYKNIDDAAVAYQEGAKRLFGEFARLG